MVGQGPLKPLILVRIQAREPHYLLTMSRIGHADNPIPPIPFKQHIFHALGQCHIWDLKRIGELLVKGSRGAGKCYRPYPRIYSEFYFRSNRKLHPSHVQCEICTYIAFLLTGNLMMLGMNALMLWVHFAIQTENPIETRIMPPFASQSLENVFIFKMLMGKKNNK